MEGGVAPATGPLPDVSGGTHDVGGEHADHDGEGAATAAFSAAGASDYAAPHDVSGLEVPAATRVLAGPPSGTSRGNGDQVEAVGPPAATTTSGVPSEVAASRKSPGDQVQAFMTFVQATLRAHGGGVFKNGHPLCCCIETIVDETPDVVPDPTPHDHADSGAQVFEVVLHTKVGDKFGLDMEFHPDRQVLPVKGVAGNLLGAWNRENPARRVQRGDRMVCINGARGADGMIQAMKAASSTPSKVSMTLVRIDGWEYLQDEEFVNAFDVFRKRPKPVEARGFVERYDEQFSSSAPASQAKNVGDSSADDGPLPEPWVTVWSKSQGKWYFFNPETKESMWTRPGTERKPPKKAKPRREGDTTFREASSGLPSPWEAVWSKSRMRYYYYDPSKNQAVWTKPKAASIKSSGGQAMDFESADKLVGEWNYDNGSYHISWVKGSLVYHESKPDIFAVYGIFVKRQDWWEAELLDQVDGQCPVPPQDGAMVRGMLRCQRRGDTAISNFQVWGADDWEEDVVAALVPPPKK